MKRWKVWVFGAMALFGLAAGHAEARPAMTPPALTPIDASIASNATTEAAPCYYGYYRPYRRYYGYGWRRGYYGYGYRRPYYGYYGYRRPYYGYRRYYGWRRW